MQSDICQRLQFRFEERNVSEKLQRLRHRHVENISNRFSFMADIKRFSVVPLSFASLTRHVYIRQEMHFDFD